MEEHLIYTDTRPRARSTGHAFGFEGNLGMAIIIAGMVSVLVVTLLFNGSNSWPVPVRLLAAVLPLALTAAYIVFFRSKKPPRYDLDLLVSLVNGRSFGSARQQPCHPCLCRDV